MSAAFQDDLFGNPVDTTPTDQASGTPARVPVNDMDLTQRVLADIASDKTRLHVDDAGLVCRCAGRTTEPVPTDLAAVVGQLLAARYLATRRRSCPGHDPVITATPAGRNAASRWRAYRRPSTWGSVRNAHRNSSR
jgi:hypothetical protein